MTPYAWFEDAAPVNGTGGVGETVGPTGVLVAETDSDSGDPGLDEDPGLPGVRVIPGGDEVVVTPTGSSVEEVVVTPTGSSVEEVVSGTVTTVDVPLVDGNGTMIVVVDGRPTLPEMVVVIVAFL